jgi:hypothetical protein
LPKVNVVMSTGLAADATGYNSRRGSQPLGRELRRSGAVGARLTGIRVLKVLVAHRTVRLATGGHLQPWLGPAVRGLIAGRWRAAVCRFPVAERVARWPNCTGCPHVHDCAYGRTVEPDPPPGAHVAGGFGDAVRPLVVHPGFPLDEQVRPGYQFPLRVVLVGPQAIAHADEFWEILRQAGGDPNAGLGPDHVLFDLLADGPPGAPVTASLPTRLDPADVVPRVRVELTGPLVLRSRDDRDRRHLVTRPTFGELLRACLRTLGPLCRFVGDGPIADEVFRNLKAAAERVPTVRGAWRPFAQVKSSSRSGQQVTVRGVVGWAEYGPLPRALVEWLTWGGRVHVGTHRTVGAGGWQTVVG